MTEDNIYQTPKSDLGALETGSIEYAGFWIRVVASIIDTLLVFLLTGPLLTVVYGFDYWTSDAWSEGFMDIVINYVLPAVVVILFWLSKSATPGKMLLGLKVISLGATQKLSLSQAVVRYVGYIPSMMVLMLGCIWVAFDRRKQGWHDKMAHTAVIRTK